MQTVDHRPPHELAGLVDIWCVLTREMDKAPDFYQERLRAGDRVFLYIACWPTPPHANFYIDIPAINHRVLFWQARQVGATGFLYWSTTWWAGLPGPTDTDGPHFPARPVKCADLGTYHSFKVNGDGILIWPGPDLTPWPSLRLEVIRDGIEDYEYHVLLDACVEKAKRLPPAKRPPAAILEQAETLRRVPKTISRTFADFTKAPEAILARRKALGDMIERLLETLGEQPPPKAFTWSRRGR